MKQCANCQRDVPDNERTKKITSHKTGNEIHLCHCCVPPKEAVKLVPLKVKTCAQCRTATDDGWAAFGPLYLCRSCAPVGGTRKYIEAAVKVLSAEGLVDDQGEVTPLGEHIAKDKRAVAACHMTVTAAIIAAGQPASDKPTPPLPPLPAWHPDAPVRTSLSRPETPAKPTSPDSSEPPESSPPESE